MVKRLLLFLTFCMAVVTLSAQKITGVVTDSETGDPIPYLNVYYDGKELGTVTDADGRYSIALRPEWRTLAFSMVGYATQKLQVSASTRTLDVRMVSDRRWR